jgi:hypothetical protein
MRLLDSGKVLLKQVTLHGNSNEENCTAPDSTVEGKPHQCENGIHEQLNAYKVQGFTYLTIRSLLKCENMHF